MNIVLNITLRVFQKIEIVIGRIVNKWITHILLKANNVDFSNFQTNGIPYIRINKTGSLKIGSNFKMNNGFAANVIGRQQKCILVCNGGAVTIGDNVGISSTAIICAKKIIIGNDVRIGGNTVIYDTDFHAIDYLERIAIPEVRLNVKAAPVIIHDRVFIGAHCTILKGIEIGENSIVGAGSVVTRSIPSNEIWAGNPAKYIKKI